MDKPTFESTNTDADRTGRRVLIIFENPAAREQAVRFCEHLHQQHKSPPQATWLPLHSLADPAEAKQATERALVASIVIFASNTGGDWPAETRLWIEQSLVARRRCEGAIVGLIDPGPATPEVVPFKEFYLRDVAHRAGMDYLSHTPPTLRRAIPNSLDSYNERAGRMTSVLDQILHTETRPQLPR